jgi:hypothetical protein
MRTCRTFNPAAGMKKQESIISLPHGGTDSYADVLFFHVILLHLTLPFVIHLSES